MRKQFFACDRPLLAADEIFHHDPPRIAPRGREVGGRRCPLFELKCSMSEHRRPFPRLITKLNQENSYVLASCTVAPGFDFQDFELAGKEELMKQYPSHKEIVDLLTR